MRPRLASLIFSLIVVFAVGALAWGATHGRSTGNAIGSAKDQAAARTTLQTGLKLSGGLVRDPTFTACGNTADACLTGSTSVATTLAALATVVHSAGGSLPTVCSAAAPGTTTGPNYTCLVEGRLHGTTVLFLLGEGWSLPGRPAPRTAVLANVEKADPKSPTPLPATPATAADVAALLPPTWARAPQACAGGVTPAVPSTATSGPSTATSGPTTSAAPLLPTSPPLPACSTSAITLNISVHSALTPASAQLATLALSKGFRLDGRPCLAGATSLSCAIWGERISSGVQQLFVATLTDNGRGDTTGTLSVTDQQMPSQS
ncbi:MAG TPA: hypothetical protein VGL75_06935 [Acidothermaceae bacterium]|jgi:hypothetical protein